MNKLVASIHPFVVNQKIEIYTEDNKLYSSVPCDIDNLSKAIIQAAKEYHCSKAYLKGAYNFCWGCAENIKNDLSKYDLTELDIEIL